MQHFLNGFAVPDFISWHCYLLPPTQVNIALKNIERHFSTTSTLSTPRGKETGSVGRKPPAPGLLGAQLGVRREEEEEASDGAGI